MIDHYSELRAELAGSDLTKAERAAAEREISDRTVEAAWQRRQRRRQEQREAALEHDLYRSGHLTASARAALAQRQNRLEHSR